MTDTEPEGREEIPPEVTELLEAHHLEPTASNVANSTEYLFGASPAKAEAEPETEEQPEPALPGQGGSE